MDELFEVPDAWWNRRCCQVCGGALCVQHAYTYVVQRQWWVKIGATSNVRRRIGEIARPAWIKHLISPAGMDWTEPLVTIRVLEEDVEHQLHLEWSEHHVAGEWFLPDSEMRAWLTGLQEIKWSDLPAIPTRVGTLKQSFNIDLASVGSSEEVALW